MDEKLKKDYISTIGVDVTTIKINVLNKSQNEDLITLTVWDLAGQNQFQNIRKTFYLGAAVALLIFDVTNKESFTNIIHWMEELGDNLTTGVPMVLVGNKIDLANRVVSKEDMDKFTLKNKGIFNTFETSALTGDGIKHLFKYCAELVHTQQSKPSSTMKKSSKKSAKKPIKKPSSRKVTKTTKKKKTSSKKSASKKTLSAKPTKKKPSKKKAKERAKNK